MRVLKIFGQGFSTTNKKVRMIAYLWFINFIFSIVVVTPIYFLLNKDFSRSMMADELAKGVDLLLLGDLAYKHQNLFPVLLRLLLIPGVVFGLLYIFLNGGIIGRIRAQDEKVMMSDFLADCARYFFRFFRVFLISIVGYFVVFGIAFRAISALFNLWSRNASTQWTVIISSNLEFLIMVLLFTIVRMFFDYVRVRLVIEDSKKTLRATLLNLKFKGKRFFRAWLLYLLPGVITVIFAVIYFAVYQPMLKMGFLLLIAFIWQQVYVLSRMWTKILFYSTEYHFFISEKGSKE
ncbi:MAG: hypothetical protein JSV96_08625 [Candidatus Aminicenantes bacterium]|nr:MAG: hypothetical protein JSV96_08625 [Candidatus Aminicenantes bacterium]